MLKQNENLIKEKSKFDKRLDMVFFIFLLFSSSIFANVEYEKPQPNRNRDSFNIVAHPLLPKVNPLSGEYIEEECDFVVAGCQSLKATRFYHHHAPPSSIYACWQFNPETYAKANFETNGFDRNVLVGDEDGGAFLLEKILGNSGYAFDATKQKSVTNIGRGLPSAQTNPKNIKVTYSKIVDPKEAPHRFLYYGTIEDGSGRKMEFTTPMHTWYKTKTVKDTKLDPSLWTPFHLHIKKVTLPNGIVLKYDYRNYFDDKYVPTHYRIEKITAENKQGNEIGWLRFYYPAKREGRTDAIIVEGSDGRKIVCDLSYRELVNRQFYRFDPDWGYVNVGGYAFGHVFLSKAKASFKPNVEYHYDGQFNIFLKTYPEGRFLRTEYKDGKVFTQFAPVGENDKECAISQYSYGDGVTDVTDAEGNLIRYRFDKHKRLAALERYQEKKLYCVEKNEWYATGEIKTQSLADAQGKIIKKVSYFYDERGNVLNEEIEGVGLPKQIITRTYSNDGFNLKLSETDAAITTRYTYLPQTNLLTSEMVYEGGKVLKRKFHQYDDYAACVQTIVDDGCGSDPYDLTGVTYRKIIDIKPKQSMPCFGMPEVVEEKTIDENGNERLLHKIIYTYAPFGKVWKEEHFDANGKSRYKLRFDYDEHENLKTEVDAEGHVKRYDYDLNNNLYFLWGPKPNQSKEITYDKANRPILIKENRDEAASLITTKKYDKLCRLKEEIDPCGFKTTYSYDSLGRVIKIVHPDGSVVEKDYDVLGNVIMEKDGKGYVTTRSFNHRNQPIEIHYPDESFETFDYDCHDNVIEHLDRNGAKIIYSYDALDHPNETKVYDPRGTLIKTTKAHYSSFSLLSSTDGEGVETKYDYDKAGRLISEECDRCKKRYVYDELGRLTKTIVDDTCYVELFDLNNRVIVKRSESLNGEVFKQETYKYDEAGNKTTVINSKGMTETTYNTQNLPATKKNALDHETVFEYDYKGGFKLTVTNPKGIKTIEKKDFRGKTIEFAKQNQKSEILQKWTKKYDFNGNVLEEEHVVYEGVKPLKTLINTWSYGPLNRVEKLTESQTKTTTYEYDKCGRLKLKTKPDGTKIYTDYDFFGRIERFHAPDFDYFYSYDNNNRLRQVEDKISKTKTTRNYNNLGLLELEAMSSGLQIQNVYDDFGRRKELILPDGSKVEYTYKNDVLYEVKRNGHIHTYLERDLEGKLAVASLPDNQGNIAINRDALSRWQSLTTPYYKAFFSPDSYDSAGNLTHYDFVDRQGSLSVSYEYDDLDQLISENEHTYHFDSLNNRLQKDQWKYAINDLNQITNDDQQIYTYDLNGNLKSDGIHTFSYDSLDRLICVQTPTETTTYTYDPFHRRQSKNESMLFLWDGDNEIGQFVDDHLTELRVLGEGLGAEISAAVLIELNDQTYIPIHDHRGCLVELIGLNAHGETNRYTAYGEESEGEKISPWRFCSKRRDDETGFFYFGRRYYNANHGRWVTGDPEGFRDGPNLYAYVHNAAMTCVDLYGLHTQRDSMLSLGWGLLGGLPGGAMNFFGIGKSQNYNSFEDHFANKSFTSSVGMNDLPCGEVGRVNGMWNSISGTRTTANNLSKMGGNIKVNYTYNASHGLYDLHEAVMNMRGIMTPPVAATMRRWQQYCDRDTSGAPYLEECHSHGGAVVYCALLHSSEEVRQRISVRAFASCKYIPSKLCRDVVHYVSEGDIVHLIDWRGRIECADTTVVLRRHPGAPKLLDHTIDSPTFYQSRYDSLNDYLSEIPKYNYD